MEDNFESDLINDVARNARDSEANLPDAPLKEYDDILV